jgi:1-deoxy-D-xylulose-5-phosphate reductoisomerase
MTIQLITVLGATGSIGTNTLDVVAMHPSRYRVFALAAHSQADKLFTQCLQHNPCYAVLVDPQAAQRLRGLLADAGSQTQVLDGEAALTEVSIAAEVDMVMAAIVGAAGLRPTLAAARAGKRILLANKESLVVAGDLFMRTVRDSGAELLPVDSEHNALFQSLPAGFDGDLAAAGVEELILTASGGPFRHHTLEQLRHVTADDACKHPNWVMGRKISVDSASLMNKGLEVIEARWLFHTPAEQIKVVVHPQSVIHSMVRYHDGSIMAQLGSPDMRTPIAYAMAWPQRIAAPVQPLDFLAMGALTFEAPDLQRFPCLKLAFDSLHAGGDASAVMNAANEVAVASFLAGRTGFLQIPQLIERALSRMDLSLSHDLDSLLAKDAATRALVGEWVAA